MSDCACDFCDKEDICQYAYYTSDCKEDKIIEAKKIVTPEFLEIRDKFQKINDEIYNDDLSYILNRMESIILDSELHIAN